MKNLSRIMVCFGLLIVVLSATMSCCSKRRLEKKHLAEVTKFHQTIANQKELLESANFKLDSLMSVPAKIDTVIKHTQIIIDHTDSLVRINNEMLMRLRGIQFDTDTIKSILRSGNRFTESFKQADRAFDSIVGVRRW
ncbi:MAG: hypothetical protein FWG79_07185 [Bacteroidales bacterium]|nr:hypothetical protein [Bacteroidales bacterium]